VERLQRKTSIKNYRSQLAYFLATPDFSIQSDDNDDGYDDDNNNTGQQISKNFLYLL
jgi:hypothetical protein